MTSFKFYIVFAVLLFSSILQAEAPSPSIYSTDRVFLDEHGSSLHFSKFKGTPLFITMTYTSCKMSCPITLRVLKDVEQSFNKKSKKAEFVIVSIDPRIDTPQKLASFKKSWKLPEETWHFLTGDKKAIQEIADYLKIHFMEIDDHFKHDSTIVWIDEEGKTKKTFENWNSSFEMAR